MEFFEQILAIFADFADPKKRIFVGYLLLSVCIALIWLVVIRKHALGSAVYKLFDPKVLFSRSSIADCKIFVINQVFLVLISPLLLSQIAIASAVYFFLHRFDSLSSGQFETENTALVVALFSVVLFVADDFSKYLLHRWMHRFPALWAIHKVHHSATTMTPITVYRVHPFETVLYGARGALAQGPVVALFVFLFGQSVSLFTVVGVSALVFAFHITGSNLRHSHISIRYWRWLERILISPAQHQIHHSIAREHHDRNFGAALAIWDWVFKSHCYSQSKDLEFGITPLANGREGSLKALYFQPLADIVKIAKRRAQKLGAPFQNSR